jgi:hypothetical protein
MNKIFFITLFYYKTVQLTGILNQYIRTSLSGPDHLIAGPFDSRTQKVSEKLTIRKPDIRLLDAYCSHKYACIFFSICSLNFGRRHVLLVHMMTVHKFEADQAENLVKEQLKDINMGSRDVVTT